MRLLAGIALCAIAPAAVRADPLRLRADAFATTATPAGLLALEADGDAGPGLAAEALVWMGGAPTSGNDTVGDVLVIALRAKTADGRAGGTVGRFVAMLGALRPVHVDGAGGRIRLPYRFDVEAYGGIPVISGLTTARTWDWVTGGRISRRLGDWGSVGAGYLQQRDDGQLATEELGVDLGAGIGKHDDVGARLAYDLANPGLAEVTVTASDQRGAVRGELHASYRAASHILPATSLFSVFGDVPAERAGTTWTWRAAPRLDLVTDLGVRHARDATAPEGLLRARLRLDATGTSALSGELRRDGVGVDTWTGARGTARIALSRALAATTELELVIPDHDRGVGAAWPWGLVAISWSSGVWDAAIAVEASASPQERRRIDMLARLGRRWGTP